MLHKEKSKLFEGNGLCVLTCHVILAFLHRVSGDPSNNLEIIKDLVLSMRSLIL